MLLRRIFGQPIQAIVNWATTDAAQPETATPVSQEIADLQALKAQLELKIISLEGRCELLEQQVYRNAEPGLGSGVPLELAHWSANSMRDQQDIL